MGKKHLFCLRCSLLLIMVFFIQCTETDLRTENIKKYIKNNYGVSINSNINRIFIINDVECGNCVYSFSEYVKENIDDKNNIIIINSRGANIDLEKFNLRRQSNPNIIIKYSTIQDRNDLFYQSAIIHISHNKVDTIVYVNPYNFIDQL